MRTAACLAVISALAFGLLAVRGDDAAIARGLKDKGVTVTETKGVVTGVSVSDGTTLTDADFTQIGKLTHLRTLDINKGLTNERLALLTGLAELEQLSTNAAQLTDEGLKPLAQLGKLRGLKLFHPGPGFSGAGLAYLVDLPQLSSVTVAGSLAFNDDGMAAVAKLSRLVEFRSWHAGQTNEGVKKLKELKNLKHLNLGQRLSYKAPACPTDDTLAIVAELKSLETLQLGEARLSFAALQQLKQLPNLKKLTLDGIDLPAADVDRLRQELPTVKLDRTEPNEAYRKRIHALFGAN